MIRVVAAGLHASVQDAGRPGLRRLGIPWAGALVPGFLHAANALVGNAAEAPAIECFEAGLELVLEAPARVALACLGTGARLEASGGADRPHALSPWRAHRLAAGTRLRLRDTGAGRTATLGVQGLDVPRVLGSASTYARSGLGGIDGRALGAGDLLHCARPDDHVAPDRRMAHASVERLCGTLLGESPGSPAGPASGTVFATVRAVPGPQDEAFTAAALDAFFDPAGWTVSAATDRMGARLDGPALAHVDAAARDIVSDAIVPGSVQVPGTGLPIVLLRDAHTAGGYPKIATLASADLAAVALARPGDRLRILRTDTAGAVRRTREVHATLVAALADTATVASAPDTVRLLSTNLVDGVTDGREPEPSHRSGT